MGANILYLVLAFYGVMILAVNGVGLAKFGPEAWLLFQTLGGAAILTLAILGIVDRIAARWVWSVVGLLIVADIKWRISH